MEMINNQRDQDSSGLFQTWFNGEILGLYSLRSEWFLEELKTFVEYPTAHKRNNIIKWLEEAYLAGYARRAEESTNVR